MWDPLGTLGLDVNAFAKSEDAASTTASPACCKVGLFLDIGLQLRALRSLRFRGVGV